MYTSLFTLALFCSVVSLVAAGLMFAFDGLIMWRLRLPTWACTGLEAIMIPTVSILLALGTASALGLN